MKIIIVEDEDMIRDGLAKLVCKINKDSEVIATAKNGKEGLEIIFKLKPDLVITDINMPQMDGLEMLTRLKELNIKHKTIVLSAYSEFEYARKAIILGVSEYILKPISVLDITQSLKNVESQLIHDKKEFKHPEALLSLEHVFQSSLLSELIIDDSLESFLRINYEIEINDKLGIFVIYMGESYETYYKQIKKELQGILYGNEIFKYSIIESPQSKEIIVVLFNIQDYKQMEKYIKYSVIANIKFIFHTEMVFGWIECTGILNMRERIHMLNNELHWNLAIGLDDIVNYDKVIQVYTLPLPYPIDIENNLKTTMCTMEFDKIDIVLNKFIKYCKDASCTPREIKENFVRFAWAIVNVGKEIDNSIYENFDSQKLLTTIMSAITWDELEKALKTLTDNIANSRGLSENNSVTSLLVKRTESIIHEFYRNGITLEEIALKLNVTSEYLGTQFKKEIGVSFSTYTKRYRIDKAKKLLIGTDLKLFQISEMIGYNDPKYFSKVFKEIIGYLPGEYRKLYK